MRERPLRVVHVTTVPEFVQHALIYDLRRLREHTEATIVCSDGPGVTQIRSEGFAVVTIQIERKVAPIADIRAIWRLVRLLRRGRFDLLHSYVPKGGLVGQLAGWLARVPHRVHSCRGLLYTPRMARWQRLLIRATDRLTNTLAHRTIYISRADFDYAIHEGLCNRKSARFTGSGIDLAHHDPTRLPPDTRRGLREEFGIRSDAPVILTVGRFVIDKGYRELADAVPRLLRELPEARFVWIAPVLDGERGVLPENLLEHPDVRRVVIRLGHQRDMRRWYAAADLLAHPSYREGVSRVVMEAAAMGLPIVASDIPGCREVVTHGVTGLLCPPRDADALASALSAALRDPGAARRRARTAMAEVRSRFDQNKLTERVWAVYEEITKRGT